MIRLDQAVAVVDCIDPDAYTTGAVDGDIVDMRDFEQVMFIVQAGTLGTNATVDFQVYQGKTSAMGTPVGITGAAITQLTEAGTDRYRPERNSDTMPPIKANGMFARIKNACRKTLNAVKSKRKIKKSATGTTIARRCIARCWFSNCPPHVT